MKRIWKPLFYIFLALIVIYNTAPFLWAISNSLKPRDEIYTSPVTYIPSEIKFENYINVFKSNDYGFLKNIFNSTVVSISVVLLSLIFGSFAGYSIARIKYPGRSFIKYAILMMTMFPQIAILGALFTIIRSLGLYNSWSGLILSYFSFTLPFTVWVLVSFFKHLPDELEQAALVDGATPFQTFYKILLPLTLPALVTTGLLSFIAAWNEFLFALTFTINDKARTVPVAIAFFSGSSQHEIPWHEIMAASVIVTIPLIILILVFQNRIIAGLTAGSVKE